MYFIYPRGAHAYTYVTGSENGLPENADKGVVWDTDAKFAERSCTVLSQKTQKAKTKKNKTKKTQGISFTLLFPGGYPGGLMPEDATFAIWTRSPDGNRDTRTELPC